jgi:hypothetical protein
MSKSHRCAWAAGFMDGDGFITIQTSHRKVNGVSYKGFYLRVGACQASETPLKELQTLFGGNINIKNSGPNHDGYNRKTQWIWTLSSKQAESALQQMLPYLLHKREVALLALDFQSKMTNSTRKITEEMLAYRESIKVQIASINSES